LALRVAPAVVLSDDHDLIDNGFAGQAWWTKAAGDVLIVAMADGQLVSVLAGVSWTTVGAGYGTAAVVRAARRAPLVTITVAVAVAVLASAYLLARRYPPGRVRAALKELGSSALTTWRQVAESQQTAAARLPWVKIPAGRPPTLEERCARILAASPGRSPPPTCTSSSAVTWQKWLHRSPWCAGSSPAIRPSSTWTGNAGRPASRQASCPSPDARYGQAGGPGRPSCSLAV
jgi:hypothetical protein